jgi:DNA-binding GntR family transcriptional regulator
MVHYHARCSIMSIVYNATRLPVVNKSNRLAATPQLAQVQKAALLPEAVYQKLRTAIVSGVFRPGQALRQEDVARQLGVSRGPLREALPKLEAEGMIVSLPHRGCTVVSLAADEIAEIFELRAMLEASLAAIAAQRRDDSSVQRLRELHTSMQMLADSKQPADRVRWFEQNYEFHNLILASAGRKHHLRILEMVRARAEPYIRMEINLTGNLAEAQEEHRCLLEAFASGDAERLAWLTRLHVQHTATRLLEALHFNSADGAMTQRLIA